MPREPLLPGFRRTKSRSGKPRYYNESRHRSLTRRQYDNLRARNAGFKNVDAYYRYYRQNAHYAPSWDRWRFNILKTDPAADVGRFSQLRHDAIEVAARREQLPRDVLGNYNDQDDPELARGDGPLGRLLRAQGFNVPNEAWYTIGDTPRGR